MPEATERDRLRDLASLLARDLDRANGKRVTLTVARNRAIRGAYAAGATYHELAKATGLSRAQVARICDLSKDRSE